MRVQRDLPHRRLRRAASGRGLGSGPQAPMSHYAFVVNLNPEEQSVAQALVSGS